MTWTYEQFRAALNDGANRQALGLEMSDSEAARIASDNTLCWAYFTNWTRQHSSDGTPAPALPSTAPPLSFSTSQSLAQAPHQAPGPPAKSRIGCFGVFLIIMAIVIAIVVLVNINRVNSSNDADQGASSDGSTTSQVTAAEKKDANARADGWQVAVSGDIYIKAAEPGTFTCGMFNCLWYGVHSVSGCSGGAYLKADIMSDGRAVGWTKAISASIMPGEAVSVKLEDVEGLGNQFRVSEAHCMG